MMASMMMTAARDFITLSAKGLLTSAFAFYRCTTALAVCCSVCSKLQSIRSITVPCVTTS